MRGVDDQRKIQAMHIKIKKNESRQRIQTGFIQLKAALRLALGVQKRDIDNQNALCITVDFLKAFQQKGNLHSHKSGKTSN